MEFLPFAREILAQEDAANAALGNGRMDVSGTLRFAASSTFVQLHIAPILPEFLDRHPLLHLDLKLSDTQMDLIEGGFDLALRNYAIRDSSLRAANWPTTSAYFARPRIIWPDTERRPVPRTWSITS